MKVIPVLRQQPPRRRNQYRRRQAQQQAQLRRAARRQGRARQRRWHRAQLRREVGHWWDTRREAQGPRFRALQLQGWPRSVLTWLSRAR
jgi:hypothetical protein